MRSILAAAALSAPVTATVSAPVALAETTESARANCIFTYTSKSPGETGRGLRVAATVRGGCKVTAKLDSDKGGRHQVGSQSETPDRNGDVLFNFRCHGHAKYRVKLTAPGDSATITGPVKAC
ncbi:hypothetical protein [Allokutzneria albata]|uniref:Uncharacterized protein n=1 Tax=Allokutzneria albata TaxID=211114 RepID=A0A1G9Y4S6_ALLAB|nr:hypothetical protein [Allokutzneria albata]SDN04037.1 hypothetical protein SAMN04489726_4599 [Allokutzneria albata]